MKLVEITQKGYSAIPVPEEAKAELMKRFPPKYPDFIGHHVTVAFGITPDKSPLPIGYKCAVRVVGYAEEDGLEALVVAVNNASHREDGKRFHITWSLDKAKGKKPAMSNDLITGGFDLVKSPYEFISQVEFYRF